MTMTNPPQQQVTTGDMVESQANTHDELMERIRILYGQFPSVVGGSILISIIMLGVLWSYDPSTTVIVWWVGFIAFSLLRIAHYIRSRSKLDADKKISPKDLNGLRQIAMLSAGVSGCIWGVVPWLFFDANSLMISIFLIVINLGMLASSVSAWSAYMPTYVAFAVPNTLPLVILTAIQDDADFMALSILLLASLLANIGYGFRFQKSILKSISLRFENLDLIEKLQHEIDRAEQASRDKTMFIAAASHDLRQPMNALRLFVNSLQEKVLPSDAKDSLNNIERSAKSLSDMLNAVLDISKFESGAAQPEKINFPIQHILSMLVKEFAPTAKDKGLRFKVVSSSATVYTDPYMLERIIRNFLSNAYRYTDSGSILIGCRHHGKNLSIEVHDTGRGIEEKHSGKIFEEFFRAATKGGSGHPTGLGLGLAIVDSLSRALSHNVRVISRGGAGSGFIVEVPFGIEGKNQQAFEPIASTEKIDAGLLIIDDDELSRNGLLAITSQWVGTVHVAASTTDAVKLIESEKIVPDAIISDFRLERDDNGVKAIGSVRNTLGKAIPGALISGDTGDEISTIAEANDLPLLRKPIAPSQLRATVMYLLKQK